MAIAERSRTAIYEGTRIPSPIPTVLQVPDELRESHYVSSEKRTGSPPSG